LADECVDRETIYLSTLEVARELALNVLRTGDSTTIEQVQDSTFALLD
jgi:hypothetical protein